MWSMLKRSFEDWKRDDCLRMAAAMSYFTIFSLPPLLLVVMVVSGVFVDPEQVSGRLQDEIAGVVGAEGAQQIESMIRNVNRPGTGGPAVVVLSVLGILFGATGAFNQLQEALNRAWQVRRDPDEGGIAATVGSKILSLAMVLTIAFLLLVSLVLSAALSAFGDVVSGWLPGGPSRALLQVFEVALSLALVTVLFALIFKVLPNAEVAWPDVWVGAFGTALLFVAGKFLLGLYFARSSPGEAFGAAGSLALLMVWIYYSAMILFFGAEFTQVWAEERGSGIQPSDDAVRV
jgi:membrane protein